MGRTADTGWRLLAQAPDPPYVPSPLLAYHRHEGDHVLHAVRAGLLPAAADDPSSEALATTFAMTDARHPFDTGSRPWSWFREPQIVAGLAHHLGSGTNAARIAKVTALLDVAASLGEPPPSQIPLQSSDVSSVSAAAEEERVDLVVEARLRNGGRMGLVVEAKFGHRLTAGQLPKARRHAAARGLDDSNTTFVVALPRLEDIGTDVFPRQRVRSWIAATWWDLLVRYERRLPPIADDEQFRAFRSLLWFHCYG